MRPPLESRNPARAGSGLVAALACLAALAGCSSKTGGYTTYTPPEGGAPNTPTGFGGSTGTTLFDAGPPSGAVDVQIHAPMAGSMLSVNAPADVSAKVTITGGTDLVDPSSVRMTLTTSGNGAAISTSPLTGPSGDSEYKGKLSLANLQSGEYTLTVVARSTTGAAGSASVKVAVDAGPINTVLSPVPGAHYKTSLFVQVAVDPGALGPVELTSSIGGTPVTLTPAGPANQYRASFDLDKPVTLQGDQLFVISATNKAGTRSDLRFVFNVDRDGPEITNTVPIPGEIVGGVVKVSANIVDGAGLNASTLQVLIGDKTTPVFRLPLKQEAGSNVYSVFFDSRALTSCHLNSSETCIVRPTVSFRAADLLGNDTTVSYEFAIDNIPPIADLVPPKIFDSRLEMGLRCSHSFDPLDRGTHAGDAPDDLCVVPQLFDLRARIEDRGNFASGLKQQPISTVDPDATAAYVLDTTIVGGEPQPLVVDTDGDGFCDAINPKLEPTTSPLSGPHQVLKIRMRPVQPGGKADFATPEPMLPAGCLPGLDPDPPLDLCKPGPQPSIAISYIGLPSIWTIEPVGAGMADTGYCFGSQLDTKANNVRAVINSSPAVMPTEGWKCIAIATADKVGNTSTSAPIRVYLNDYKYNGQDERGAFCTQAVPAGAGPPPSCTGTYDKATGTVSQKACLTRTFKFATPEICFLGDCG